MATDETYRFDHYAIDLNGSGIIDADGHGLTVEGDYPLQPGELVAILGQPSR
jgi:hypothetical protein